MVGDPRQRAGEALARGDPEEGLRLLEGVDDDGAAILRGRCFEAMGRVEDATEAFEEAARLDPGSATALLALGVLQRETGRVEAAIASFEEARRRDPQSVDAVEELVLTWSELGHQQRVGEVWAAAMRSGMPQPQLLRARARVQSRQGRHEDAIVDLERAAELVPDCVDTRIDLASSCFRAGRFDRAFEAYARARLKTENRSRRATLGMCQALCRKQQGRFDEAADVLREVVQEQPGEHRAILHLGLALADAGRFSEAFSWFDRLVEAADEDPSVRGWAGEALLAKAKACLTKLDDPTTALDAIDTLVGLVGRPGVDAARELAEQLVAANRPEDAALVIEECDAVEALL